MEHQQRDSQFPPQHRSASLTLGVLILLGALGFTLAAALIFFWPEAEPAEHPLPTSTQAATARPLGIAEVNYPTPVPTVMIPPTAVPLDWVRPTAAAGEILTALNQPVISTLDKSTIRRSLNPLTIIPWRSRSGVITYAVKKGESLRSIAEKFGIEQNTIIWSNDRFYVNAMRVGLELTILPVNGVYQRIQEPQTVASVAELYKVDPYAIIDSEYNALFGSTPQTVLPAGLYVVVPGGTGSTQPIYWDPGIVMTTSYTTDGSNPVGAGISVGTETALFAVGDPGSCGKQAVSGGSSPVGAPIWDSYTISQDFSWSHGGIDLAVPSGTRVYAAGSGTVIFKGFSTWGYGYTVVLAHGSTLSLYGHLNGAFVGCGQIVSAGQNIAVTGNSGRSSGPHLHFEIRGSNGAPVSPWDYQGF
ncbi:MAG: M23 family metallopeptidase [Chloroflexi bacterium]|nr:M23 family metallopeptidase [Chloroflexota bacterium]